MKVKILEWLSKIYWSLPFSEKKKDRFRFLYKRLTFTVSKFLASPRNLFLKADLKADYINQVLSIPELIKSAEYVAYENGPKFERVHGDPKLIAYYLPHSIPRQRMMSGGGRE